CFSFSRTSSRRFRSNFTSSMAIPPSNNKAFRHQRDGRPALPPFLTGKTHPRSTSGRDNGRRSGRRFCGFRRFRARLREGFPGGAGRFAPTTVSLPPPSSGYWFSSSPLKYRSEEHTSELQSRENLVCRLLLEKNNTQPSP